MASPDWKLSILTFPQFWDAAARRLDLRALVLPRDNPLHGIVVPVPLAPSDPPAFADAKLSFAIQFIPDLEHLPDPANVRLSQTVSDKTPPGLRALYEELALRFPLALPDAPSAAPAPRRPNSRILKYLPVSYQTAFPFCSPRTPHARIDNSFRCALRTPPDPDTPPPPPFAGMRWAQVIAVVMSQPRLAERLGLVYRLSLSIPEITAVERGGWLYVSLAADTTYSSLIPPEPTIRLYAARIPPLNAEQERTLFASVLFPVPAPPLSFDENIVEAQTWDDGFAKIVHSAQPRSGDLLDNGSESAAPVQDAGIQLGWDDEQLVIWFNRQADANPLVEQRDSPLGVHGYRVDVRRLGTETWTSLMRVDGELKLGEFSEQFLGEHSVRVAPVQLHGLRKGDFWMPSYFARWNGKSLCVGDDFARNLNGNNATGVTWKPVGVDAVPLRYGETYQFRVRLADLSGGGPDSSREPVHSAEAPITTCSFRRFVPPKTVRVKEIAGVDPDDPQLTYEVRRPLLGYPSLVYTGFPNAEQVLLAERAQALNEARELGMPDPDVVTLEIEVAVADPAIGEKLTYRTVYVTTRQFPTDATQPLSLSVAFQDKHDLSLLAAPAETGALPLPSARDLRLRLSAVCRPDPDLAYFGSEESRRGAPLFIQTRAHSQDESNLFAVQLPTEQLNAYLLQPDPTPDGHLAAVQAADGRQNESSGDLAQRLAAQVDLVVGGLSFSGKPKQRTIFGCSGTLRHILSPDHGAITFGSKNELTHRWIAVLSLVISRDWTWDALADEGFEITRQLQRELGDEVETETVGTLELRRGIHHIARQSANPKNTRIVFFDAIDPKPSTDSLPIELGLTYTLTPRWKHQPTSLDFAFTASLKLPMATPPVQTPKLSSAGIGLSPYNRSTDYSSSEIRRRALWLEFAEPVADSRDSLFARVLAYAPDPMLTGLEPPRPPTPIEPPLPIPSELIRRITPGQSPDNAGLDAMQQLLATDSPRHFYVPLPPGLSAESPELFGFFAYELRVGHRDGWSTAQARFGPPLRVTGIQHPAPALLCETARRRAELLVSAAYARPVAEGQNLLPRLPKTEVWALLYAQVAQVDGQDCRNVLIGRRPALPQLSQTDERERLETIGIARWQQNEIDQQLRALALPRRIALSVLAVELLPEFERKPDPLGADLGEVRILRTSPLIPVPEVCL
jgi:hypothetical protein